MCLLSHNVITTCTNLHLFCEICFWTLIEIFCFYTMFITFVRWRLSVGIKRFTYLLTYLRIYRPSSARSVGCIIFCPTSRVPSKILGGCESAVTGEGDPRPRTPDAPTQTQAAISTSTLTPPAVGLLQRTGDERFDSSIAHRVEPR